jgi:multiple sugar transport system substrate-binding protein
MNDSFGAGKAALNTEGSWMIGTYYGYKGVDVGIAPTPVGPNGRSMSMLNGLADSVWPAPTTPRAP